MGLSGFQIRPVSGPEIADLGGLNGPNPLQNPSQMVGSEVPQFSWWVTVETPEIDDSQPKHRPDLKNQTIPLTSLKSTVITMFQSLTELPNQLHLMVLNTFQFTLLQLKKLINWNQSLQQKKEKLTHSKLDQSLIFQPVLFLKNSKKCSLPRELSLLWRSQ